MIENLDPAAVHNSGDRRCLPRGAGENERQVVRRQASRCNPVHAIADSMAHGGFESRPIMRSSLASAQIERNPFGHPRHKPGSGVVKSVVVAGISQYSGHAEGTRRQTIHA
jgi:hypothetical protein